MFRKLIAFVAFVLILAACEERSPSSNAGTVVAERYITPPAPALNIDSIATHRAADGATWLFATAKEGNVVRIFDAATGAFVRDLGETGTEPGQFRRPNGIATLDGLLVVVERDNRRVQIFDLPEMKSLATFGTEELVLPYGAWLRRVDAERYDLYVTDAYETADEQVPPESELDRRVHLWNLRVERDRDARVRSVAATHALAFGETSGPGVLRVVESLWGDPAHGRLLIAEEDPAGGRVIKVYTLDGRFTGEVVGDGVFASQPEGIALYACDDGSGYWITADQSEGSNVFHAFDRRSLAHAGAFRGAATQNTDGVWLSRDALAGMPDGAFFAVHDDQAVAAFDWNAIADALGLKRCPAA